MVYRIQAIEIGGKVSDLKKKFTTLAKVFTVTRNIGLFPLSNSQQQ